MTLIYLVADKSIHALEKTLNEELVTKLSDRYRTNKLSINDKKFDFVLFKPKQKQKTYNVNR